MASVDITQTLLAELEEVAAEVAVTCGDLITTERPAQLDVTATKSSATDIVTDMDQRSEALARALLAQRRPDDGVLGEEGIDVVGTTGITWVVDPIDGTVNYLYNLPHHAVSVAAVIGDAHSDGAWESIAAAVYVPQLDALYLARREGGSRLIQAGKEQRLHYVPADSLATALVATGFGYAAEARARQGQLVAGLLPQIRDIRRLGAASVDLCQVASGLVDLYYESGLNSWDLAAGWLIAAEAGAEVRGFDSVVPSRTMVMAGDPALLDQLTSILRDLGAQTMRW